MKYFKDLPSGTIFDHLLEVIRRIIMNDNYGYSKAKQDERNTKKHSDLLTSILIILLILTVSAYLSFWIHLSDEMKTPIGWVCFISILFAYCVSGIMIIIGFMLKNNIYQIGLAALIFVTLSVLAIWSAWARGILPIVPG